MADLRPPIDAALSAFGVPATVTRPAPDTTPIVTSGFWVSDLTEVDPFGHEFAKRDPRRVFVISRAVVPIAPKGTEILAPELLGESPKRWVVDATDRFDSDEIRVIVVQRASY